MYKVHRYKLQTRTINERKEKDECHGHDKDMKRGEDDRHIKTDRLRHQRTGNNQAETNEVVCVNAVCS